MKLYILPLVFIFSFFKLEAQSFGGPSFTFGSAVVPSDSVFCIDVTFKDFSDLHEIILPIRWDAEVLEFQNIGGLEISALDLTLEDFDLSKSVSGYIVLNWKHLNQGCNSNTEPLDLEDGAPFFSLCFRMIGGYGSFSEIFVDFPPSNCADCIYPIVYRPLQNVNDCFDIGYNEVRGIVSNSVKAFEINISDVEAATGDAICFDFSVNNFDDIQVLEFEVAVDDTYLQFDQLQLTNENPLNLQLGSTGNFGLPSESQNLKLSYYDQNLKGVSILDSSILFKACYTIIKDCIPSKVLTSSISVLEDAINFEVYISDGSNQNNSIEIAAITRPGTLTVRECNPIGIKINPDCGGPVSLGDEICIPFIAGDNFESVSGMEYIHIIGNPGILSFTKIDNIHPDLAAAGLANSNFNALFYENNGVVGLNWSSSGSGVTLNEGDVLYEVCFKVVGLGGNTSILTGGEEPKVYKQGSSINQYLNASSCQIAVTQPEQVVLVASDAKGQAGSSDCIDITVQNFEEVDSVYLNFLLDADIGTIDNITLNLDLVGALSVDIVDQSLAIFTIQSLGNQPITLENGNKLFSVCFTYNSFLGCRDLLLYPLASTPSFVSNTSSAGNDILLQEIQGGEICASSAPGFNLFFSDASVNYNDTVCISVTSSEFDEIIGSEFTLSWNPSILNYLKTNLGIYTGFSIMDEASNTSLGNLPVEFLPQQATTIPRDSILMDICFTAVGEIGDCSYIRVGQSPDPIVESVDGFGNLQSDSSIICIKDTVRITSIDIVPESCENKSDGSISIVIEYEGEDPVVWFLDPNGFPVDRYRPDPLQINNLAAGEYLLIISTPEGFIRDTLVVPISPFDPNVNAGEDLPISCQRNAAEVTGSFDNIPVDYKNFWKDINGGVVSEQSKSTITSPGTYYFELVLDSTGCAYRDTLEVLPKFVPSINISGDSTIFCLDSVQLNAEIIPSTGNNSITDWFWYDSNPATNPPSIASGESLTVGEAGVYYLRGITDEKCQGIDTFNLKEGRIYPTADGGMDTTIVCGETITLNSGNSVANSNLGQLAIEWITIDSSLDFSSNIPAEQPGMVVLKVTDDFNQCVSFDTINIIPDADYPFLNFNFEAKDPSGIQLDCNTDDYNLMTSGFDVNLYEFNWNVDNLNGISSTSTLNPTFTEGGNYTLTITQKANTQCTVSKTIQVREDFDFPSVGIDATSAIINCYNPEVILSGVIEGAKEDYALKWYRQSNLIEEVLLEIPVSEAGEYTLEITDVNTYCKADTTIFIDKNVEYPTIAAISSEETLDCITEEVRLAIFQPSPILVPSFELDWATPDQSDYTTDPSDSLAIFTSTPGTYTVTLTNSINGCSTMRDIVVIENRDYPTAEISNPDVLTCADSIVELRAAFSLDAAANKFNWNNLDPLGLAPKATEGSITEVLEPGQYLLTVLDPSNQCSSFDTVTVTQDIQQPQVQIATPEILTCTNNSVLLLATVTNVSGPYQSFWNGLEGQSIVPTDNQDIVNTSEMGNYELRVVNTINGCSVSSSVVVESDNNFPVARAVESIILPCQGTPVTLTNEGSSEGADFSYQWMIVSTEGDLSNPTLLEPSVTLPGRYALTVSNALNGCTAMDTVAVILDPSLTLAATGDDVKICEDFYELTANLPSNTFGRWVPIGTPGVLLTPEEPTSQVQTLQEGANLFEWILSTASCSDYSSDTVNVFVAKTPLAADDGTTLLDGTTEITIGLLDNDVFDLDFASSAVYTNPVEGSVILDPNGTATYTVRSGFFGEDQFAYILCNEFCENLCDTALVFIDIPFDPNYEAPPLPNAITPNGDGLNDAFVFEILENPDKIYPDNEFIVFNRWGDIVYTQRPYDNNWNGTASDGKELPHGTYYYVLRLDISEGIILKGDITIIKKD